MMFFKKQSESQLKILYFLCMIVFMAGMILCGCSGGGGDSDETDDNTGNQAPTAQLSASASSGSAPLSVTFDASSSTDSDGSIAAYAWSFGDGDTASGVTATHTYSETGTFTAKLTVTDDDGLTASATQDIVVQGYAPDAQFSVSAQSGTLFFTFDASASTDSYGSIVSYAWDFGDGDTGSGGKRHPYVCRSRNLHRQIDRYRQ